jgi:hypothetical protein
MFQGSLCLGAIGAILAAAGAPEPNDHADKFVYDPMNPVPTPGRGFFGSDHKGGSSTNVRPRRATACSSTAPVRLRRESRSAAPLRSHCTFPAMRRTRTSPSNSSRCYPTAPLTPSKTISSAALSRGLRKAAGLDAERPGLQSYVPTDADQLLLCRGRPVTRRDQQQQLPLVRPQP